jgi:hypothetical protein
VYRLLRAALSGVLAGDVEPRGLGLRARGVDAPEDAVARCGSCPQRSMKIGDSARSRSSNSMRTSGANTPRPRIMAEQTVIDLRRSVILPSPGYAGQHRRWSVGTGQPLVPYPARRWPGFTA